MIFNVEKVKKEHQTVVSLKTECFKRGSSFVKSRSIRTLKRKSFGFDILSEFTCDSWQMDYIENLESCEDGVYELIYSGLSYDYESGHEEYDGFKLVEFNSED